MGGSREVTPCTLKKGGLVRRLLQGEHATAAAPMVPQSHTNRSRPPWLLTTASPAATRRAHPRAGRRRQALARPVAAPDGLVCHSTPAAAQQWGGHLGPAARGLGWGEQRTQFFLRRKVFSWGRPMNAQATEGAPCMQVGRDRCLQWGHVLHPPHPPAGRAPTETARQEEQPHRWMLSAPAA